MTVAVGFGQAHIVETKNFLHEVARLFIPRHDVYASLDAAKELAGYESITGLRSCRLSAYAEKVSDDKYGFTVIVEGWHRHYRVDHPLSPDGVVMFSIPFCIVVKEDDNLGRREYISIGTRRR